MAALATQTTTGAGLAPAFVAADAAGDSLAPGEDVVLHVKNASAADIVATVASPTPCSQGATHNLAVTVSAGGERLIGPLPAQRFARATTGRVHVTYSAVASVTVAAYRV